MSTEQGITPTPSGDLFYDALIKRLWLDDGSVDYPGDQLSFKGSTTGRVGEFKLSDYYIMGLEELPSGPQRNEQSRRALLTKGVGCLSLYFQVQGEAEQFGRTYIVTRPADLSEESTRMFGLPFMHAQYPDLVKYDLNQPRVFRFMPTPEEGIINAPLEHPYLREVYEEIVSTFR